jgi:hypothetical protein
MKWKYLTQNQKLVFGFTITIIGLIVFNALLFFQYTIKSKENLRQSIDQSLVEIDKIDTKNDYDESIVTIKSLQTVAPKPNNSTTASNQPSTIQADLANSIQSIDDTLNAIDIDIDLVNLSK